MRADSQRLNRSGMKKPFFVALMAFLVLPSLLLAEGKTKRWALTQGFGVGWIPGYFGIRHWIENGEQATYWQEQSKTLRPAYLTQISYFASSGLELALDFTGLWGEAKHWSYLTVPSPYNSDMTGSGGWLDYYRFVSWSASLGCNFYVISKGVIRPYLGGSLGVIHVATEDPVTIHYRGYWDSYWDSWDVEIYDVDVEEIAWTTALVIGRAGVAFAFGKKQDIIIFAEGSFMAGSVQYEMFADTGETYNWAVGGPRILIGTKLRLF